MASPSRTESVARRRVIWTFVSQGVIGLALMLLVTWSQRDVTAGILARLGPDAPVLILLFLVFATTLALLKFELTDLIFVSLVITAYTAMFPLLGAVLSSWIAVFVSIVTRFLSMQQIGPVKINMADPPVEYVKTFGLFGTYGIPVICAATVYEWMHGELPVMHATSGNALKIALGSVVMIVTNLLLMFRPARSYGYSLRKIAKLDLIDASIYLVTLPYAIITAFSYAALGWPGTLALAYTGICVNYVGRNLAYTRSRSQQQLQRLASLTNIGKTISLRFTTDQLLMVIYTECRKIVDCSLFTIALLDESTNELSFELDVREDVFLPKDRMAVGEGLNSWVVKHHQPLLVGSVAEERRYGVKAIKDSKPTESWLGVPMIA
ncbi:MAG: multi-sensor signal transduction histidine kinase, partial [Acidobacteria bacterium]|nr:multi-sensor signal transduction histidine kinase [Acidobacteriota bacterium]